MSGSCCARGFDIIVNNVKVVTNFSPERDQGGIHHSGAEANTGGLFGQPPPPPSTSTWLPGPTAQCFVIAWYAVSR